MDIVVYGYEEQTWDPAAESPPPPANSEPVPEAA